jgi:hypothetical protein
VGCRQKMTRGGFVRDLARDRNTGAAAAVRDQLAATISAPLGEIDRTYRLEAPLPSRRRVRSYASERTAKKSARSPPSELMTCSSSGSARKARLSSNLIGGEQN